MATITRLSSKVKGNFFGCKMADHDEPRAYNVRSIAFSKRMTVELSKCCLIVKRRSLFP
jgi:hypothetical protein